MSAIAKDMKPKPKSSAKPSKDPKCAEQAKLTRSLRDSLCYEDKRSEVPEEERDKYVEFLMELATKDQSVSEQFTTAKQWQDRVLELRKKYKIHPRKAQLRKLYLDCTQDGTIMTPNLNLEQYLTIRQSRSLSGVLVLAVLMSPYPVYVDSKTGKIKQQKFSCKHNCYYCPNEPGMPRSYLSAEAAVSRAVRADFDAIDQFYARANTLKKLGHDVDKIELLVLGGTFCQFPREYQESFIRDLFWSANTFYDGIRDFAKKRPRKSLSEEIKIHETATKCRIIGMTLETRPDTIRDFATIRRFREYGATRLQIGVQHIDDDILKHINRGCYNQDTIRAVRLLKNAGYKIDIHLMPNLPSTTPEKDKKMFNHLLNDDLIQCDQWKVYPCQTVDYSLIKKWYERGEYKPYSLEQLIEVILDLKSKIHPWIRLNRIFRALPEQNITSGVTMTNFRQHLYHKMNERGLKCKCIRCREVGTHIRRAEVEEKDKDAAMQKLRTKLSKSVILKKRCYKSSGGDEVYLSFESEDEEVLYGFVRLRLPPIYILPQERKMYGLNPDTQAFLNQFELDKSGIYGDEQEYQSLYETFPELYKAALVREAHVYGAKQNVKRTTDTEKGFGDEQSLTSEQSANVGHEGETNRVRQQTEVGYQSKGYGKTLMLEAEKIAKSKGYARVAVIAGVGTRLYYRLKLGYKTAGTYMVKDLDASTESDVAVNAASTLSTEKFKNLRKLRLALITSVVICVGLYMLSTFLSILFTLFFTTVFIAYLDYLHFYKIQYDVKMVNRSLLLLSKFGLVLINLAVLCKYGSAFFPHLNGLRVPYILREMIGGASQNDGGEKGDCYCYTYWSLSLVLYVATFYCLKVMYHKRVIIMIQNPLFGNDSGIKSVPFSMVVLLMGQIVAFTLCQFLCLNYVTSHCTDESPLPPPWDEYDKNSMFGCHDTFEAIDCWIAIFAISFDAMLFSLFCSKWYALMLIFMEEMAFSVLVQFSLVVIAMISCIIDSAVHLYYYFKQEPFDSFVATPAMLLDCAILAACIVMSFTESQKYILNLLGFTNVEKYYQQLENIGYALHIM